QNHANCCPPYFGPVFIDSGSVDCYEVWISHSVSLWSVTYQTPGNLSTPLHQSKLLIRRSLSIQLLLPLRQGKLIPLLFAVCTDSAILGQPPPPAAPLQPSSQPAMLLAPEQL